MLSQRTTVSDGVSRVPFEAAREALLAAVHDNVKRIAFAGYLPQGRAGIAVDLVTGKVTGHKIDPLPDGIDVLLQHFPQSKAREAVRLASTGVDVFIGGAHNGIAIKWCGRGVEVYGAGDDSH